MPSAADRASKYLWFNASGDPTVVTGDAAQPLTHSVYLVYPTNGQTAIPVPADYTPGSYDLSVYLNGVKQVVGVDYVENSASLITLTNPATLGDVIEFSIGGVFDVTLVRTGREEQSFTGLTTPTITLTTASYTPGAHEVDVFFNGALLATADYTETNSTTITLGFTPVVSDQIRVIVGRVVNATNVSRSQVGAALYPQTGAEIAAGVTPADYGYAPGDVRRYGANTTGDSTQAVANALLAADEVFFPFLCTVSTTLAVTRAGQRIYGTGTQSGVSSGMDAGAVFSIAANDVTLEDFAILGGATSSFAAHYGIYSSGGRSGTVISRMKFSGTGASTGLNVAVYASAASMLKIDRIAVTNLIGTDADSGYGVYTSNSVDCTVSHSSFTAGATGGRRAVVFDGYSRRCVAVDCYATGFWLSGFFLNGSLPGFPAVDSGFSRCLARSCCAKPTALDGSFSLAAALTRPFVNDCRSVTSSYWGLLANATGGAITDFTCTDLAVYSAAQEGISLKGLTRPSISGGVVSFCGTSNPGFISNMIVGSDGTTALTGLFVSGVRSDGGASIRSALYVDGATLPLPSGITLAGNVFDGGLTQVAEFTDIPTKSDLVDEITLTGATPSVAGFNRFLVNNGGATSITSFRHAVEGQTIQLRFANGNSTVVNAVAMQLSGGSNFTGTADDMLVLQYRSSVWYEVSRSVN
jgi:hypothetical protein